MQLQLHIDLTETIAGEFAKVAFEMPGRTQAHVLDVNFGPALKRHRNYTLAALDFFLVAAAVYAVDKAVSREKHAEDRWTRDLGVIIPVHNADAWNAVADDFSECVSFLTGDVWRIRFSGTNAQLVRIRRNRRKRVRPLLPATAVSLFSGGLDSFIGAIDYLCPSNDNTLLLVSHYERDVKGPMSDQDRLFSALSARFPGRIDHFQMRVGLQDAGAEISFRSRSLLFLATGMLAAQSIARDIPLFIPENGPIALNMPLTSTRRGSCSTRTAHPHFLEQLRSIVQRVGLNHEIINPYEFSTKGEMVFHCADLAFLAQHVFATVSCAKAGRKLGWAPGVRACGSCVPCLFRRASLYTKSLDTEVYHKDVCAPELSQEDLTDDTLALLALLKRNPTLRDISVALCANGPAPLNDSLRYSGVVLRMIDEVRSWLKAKASTTVRTLAGV